MRHRRHKTPITDIIGWTLVGTLAAIIIGTFVFGSIYIQACTDKYGHNACVSVLP